MLEFSDGDSKFIKLLTAKIGWRLAMLLDSSDAMFFFVSFIYSSIQMASMKDYLSSGILEDTKNFNLDKLWNNYQEF